jgi:hypothetical protein
MEVLRMPRVRLRPSPYPVPGSLSLSARENAARAQSQIDSYHAEIKKLFAQHPDHLFGSLPGGTKIAPRLLGEIGRRSRFEDQPPCSAGGNSRQLPVWKDPQGLSPAALQQAAPPRCASVGQPESAILSVGCRHYEQLRTRQEPACALHGLGQRWLKIL